MIEFNYHTDAGWLSNFWSSSFEWDGRVWPTVEHFYQARKTNEFAAQEWVRTRPTAAQAKKIGGQLHSMRHDWEEVKEQVMLEGLRLKFQQNPPLAARLLETGSQRLVHTAPWGDSYWGSPGRNRLGELLMQVRLELRLEVEGHGCGDADGCCSHD